MPIGAPTADNLSRPASPLPTSPATWTTTSAPDSTKETTPAHLSQIFSNILLRSFEFAQEIIQFFIGLFKGKASSVDKSASRNDSALLGSMLRSGQFIHQDKPSEQDILLHQLRLSEIEDRKLPFMSRTQGREKSAQERLSAVQDLGLLIDITREHFYAAKPSAENALSRESSNIFSLSKSPEIALKGDALGAYKSDHFYNITHANFIAEIIDLYSREVSFNLSAFLEVKADLLDKGILGALDQLKQDDLNEECLLNVCVLLYASRPKPRQADDDHSKRLQNIALENLKNLKLSEHNLNIISNLKSMVQCGVFVNRIESMVDPDTQEEIGVTPRHRAKDNAIYTRILISAGAK